VKTSIPDILVGQGKLVKDRTMTVLDSSISGSTVSSSPSTKRSDMKRVVLEDTPGTLPPLATLKCAVCSEYLKAPVTLPCLHTGCHSCFVKQAGPFSPIPEGTNKPLPPASFPCPVCDEDASVPRDPGAISTDTRLERLIELIQETRHLCDNCGEIAEVSCSVCTSSMCSGCFSSTHAAPVFQSHVAQPLESAKLAQLSNCSEHGSQLEFWCDNCSKGVCQVCLLKGSHKGHSYTPVREVRNAVYISVKNSLKSAMSFKREIEAAKAQVEQEISILSAQHQQVCDEIDGNFEKIEAAVKARRAALLQDAKELRSAKERSLNSQKESIERAIMDVSDAIERSMALVNYSNDLELVRGNAPACVVIVSSVFTLWLWHSPTLPFPRSSGSPLSRTASAR